MFRRRLVAMQVLQIRNLRKRREQSGSAFELYVPDFVLEPGRFYGVSGPSGSGKSTLLDLLALVLRPTAVEQFQVRHPETESAWEVNDLWRRGDEDALAAIRRSTFGYVLQSGGLIEFLTVRQNLMIPFQLIERAPNQKRIDDMASRFGIGRELGKKPRHLSIGQRQRVAILRALMVEPTLVLADEPTAAIDRVRAKQVATEFRALALEGKSTIVMVSHDHELLTEVSDEILELSTTVDAVGTAISIAQWTRVARDAGNYS
jgi:putative ABC transport system ATP-binding protein